MTTIIIMNVIEVMMNDKILIHKFLCNFSLNDQSESNYLI